MIAAAEECGHMELVERFRNERHLITAQEGQVIFKEGDFGAVMFLMISGEADVLVGGKVVDRAATGSIVGEMALIDQPMRSATVIARSSCRLLPIDVGRFDDYCRETPDFARYVMKVMADRIRRMNVKLSERAVPA